ncbi:hypothetical protein C8R45DRAFT_99139 [Mycena sanguinolenta]|nr:hypothetical protein C8R45DRAFT_99139 [Mycena sanguinolenta]
MHPYIQHLSRPAIIGFLPISYLSYAGLVHYLHATFLISFPLTFSSHSHLFCLLILPSQFYFPYFLSASIRFLTFVWSLHAFVVVALLSSLVSYYSCSTVQNHNVVVLIQNYFPTLFSCLSEVIQTMI